MNLANIMDAIANALIDAQVVATVYSWPTDNANVPCAVVAYPIDPIDFDMTFQRGSDRLVIPVYFLVGRASDRTARDQVSAVIDGAGSIKVAIDGDLGSVVQTARVMACQIQEFTLAGVSHLAARFDIEIYS